MRTVFVSPAIVLRTWPFGESDLIVSLLTEDHGKLRGIAKGAKRSRKRFANCLEPFSLVTLRFQERLHGGLALIVGCELQSAHRRLASSLEKIAYASYFVEITEGLIGEREPNRAVFDHLRETLLRLDHGDGPAVLAIAFELRLLQLAGYQPMFDSCRRCGVDRLRSLAPAWHFSPRDGGILCGGCARFRKELFPLTSDAVELLSAMQKDPTVAGGSSAPPFTREIRSALLRFVRFQLGKDIKSAAFLDRFAAL
ncbi:MAG TPA: DNA repair protein RecO [Candidatus Eisenbacteria bacterium]|nr:DNA repair protein RecO [Candidatus Eisenbacteria bacterium]